MVICFVYTQPQTEYNIHWIPKNYHEETDYNIF